MNAKKRLTDYFMKWKIFSAWLCLALVQVAGATDALYQNWSSLYYVVPSEGNQPPQLDTFAFDNESVYSVTYNTFVNNQVRIFEPWWNTRCFTNFGEMIANAPYPTNFNTFSFYSTGVAFRFDTQAGNSNVMADTFYNPGSVRCDSYRDGNNFFEFGGFAFIFQTSIGVCEVAATNIISPGEIVASPNGRIQLIGTNVDLSRATLTMENVAANVGGIGDIGLNTNFWDPHQALTATNSYSALFRVAPGELLLGNSTPYFHFTATATNNLIIRTVFIQDTSPSNVTYNVYFDSAGIGVGGGNATVEWIGSYLDSFSGNTYNNYLYLNDDYVRGSSTNVQYSATGLPDNFTFLASDTKLIYQAPAGAGFYDVILPDTTISNAYAFANADLISSSVTTNKTGRNPSGALTNLPGRIYVTGSRDLDLTLANVTGPNYMSIQAPYQFEGSAGAQIVSPYSDINVGVTNGFLTVSNLMQPSFANWSGTVQAWSTRWLYVENFTNITSTATNVYSYTNDYRVLLVGSQLKPTTLAYVQDLLLHGTNSLVLSDGFHVLRKLSVDARNLTLTTNEPGNGATSLTGELDLFSSVVWSSSLPNLRNLTNNGFIRVANGNPVYFASAASPGGAFINHGTFADSGAFIYVTNFESDGIFSNALNTSFTLQSQEVTFTNGLLHAGYDISIGANTILMSNVVVQSGRGLSLRATNWLTDGFYLTNGFYPNTTNLNFWSVGLSNTLAYNGLALPIKPRTGDLLGTTITNYVYGPNKAVTIAWAGTNQGKSVAGFSNNAAIGHFILDSLDFSSIFKFTGVSVGATNALYVDWLDLRDQATNRTLANSNFVALGFSTNLVIYYARATVGGVDISDKMNGKNTNHLRWVPQYTGYFSATNLVYPNGTTNPINISVAQSTLLDSDGDGIDNAHDPTPFFAASELIQTITMTNIGGILYPRISWTSPPGATNFVLYSLLPDGPFTNILTTVISPSLVPPAGGWPVTNSVVDLSGISRYYMERLDLNTTITYGL